MDLESIFTKIDLIKILARPQQLLEDHIANMLAELPSLLRQTPIHLFPSLFENAALSQERIDQFNSKLGKCILVLSILCHDFGKLAPFFQYYIQNLDYVKAGSSPKLPKNWRKYSYHTHTSAIFASFLIPEILNQLEDEFCEVFSYLEEPEELYGNFLEWIELAIVIAILNHHNRNLKGSFKVLMTETDVTTAIEIFQQIFGTTGWDKTQGDQSYITKWFNRFWQKMHFLDESIDIEKAIFWRNFWGDIPFDWTQKVSDALDGISNSLKAGIRTVLDDTRDRWKILLKTLELCDSDNEYREKLFWDYESYPNFFYFFVEFLYSVLCALDEWDAKFNDPIDASSNPPKRHYFSFEEERSKITLHHIETFREKCIASGRWDLTKISPIISSLRENTYNLVVNNLGDLKRNGIFTLSAPTGAGKTLALLGFAFDLRELMNQTFGYRPKILYCLPFLSITDQVMLELQAIFSIPKTKIQSPLLTVHHHLAEINWHILNDEAQTSSEIIYPAKYFIDLWRSDIILTTFVKFFESIFNPTKHNILRFHRITGSIIILDEVQCIPTKYWDLIAFCFKILCKFFNCSIILSTATQPAIITDDSPQELADALLETRITLDEKETPLHDLLDRYQLLYEATPVSLEDFQDRIIQFCASHPNSNIMIALNTKHAARETYLKLESHFKPNVYLLSGYLLPRDRQKKVIELQTRLKNSKNRTILVTTQVIEAGVDVSFDILFRDFAPLDSIIQVCGRCNRHFENSDKGTIYVVRLNAEKTPWCNIVYRDRVALEMTHEILSSPNASREKNGNIVYEWTEKTLRESFRNYFQLIREKKRTKIGTISTATLNFEQILSEFVLIEEIRGTAPLLILDDDEAQELYEKILEWIKKRPDKPIKFPNSFFQHSISMNQKDWEYLRDLKAIEPIRNIDDQILFYILDLGKAGNEEVYKYSSGLLTRP